MHSYSNPRTASGHDVFGVSLPRYYALTGAGIGRLHTDSHADEAPIGSVNGPLWRSNVAHRYSWRSPYDDSWTPFTYDDSLRRPARILFSEAHFDTCHSRRT
jgi:hypothetical protein